MKVVSPYLKIKPRKYNEVVVDTEIKLMHLHNLMKDLDEFAYDTETNTLRVYGKNKDFLCVGVSISWGACWNFYIPLNHRRIEDMYRNIPMDMFLKYMKPIFERKDVLIIGWNIKFDMHVLARLGIVFKTKSIFDPMLAKWLCDENTANSLKECTKDILKVSQTHFNDVVNTVPKEVKKSFGVKGNKKATFDLVLIDEGYPYAIDDAFYAWYHYKYFIDLVAKEDMEDILYNHMFPFTFTLFRMEERGVDVDLDLLDEMSERIKVDLEDLLYKMVELLGAEFNANSSQQLGEILFGYQKPILHFTENEDYIYSDKAGREKIRAQYEKAVQKQEESPLMKVSFAFKARGKTKAGAPSTDSDTLWELSKMNFKNKRKQEGVEFCKLLSQYKVLSKLDSAFIQGMKEQIYDDGKVHCSFNQIGTDSGRLSCSSPNLQQLPRVDEKTFYQIRRLFIGSIDPVTGKRKKIIASDYSNLEIRVTAHFSEDPHLLNMFAKGDDVHGSTAVNMFELDCDPNDCKKKYKNLRQAAKILNFLNQVA